MPVANRPPHDDKQYHCNCVACENWRENRVTIGALVSPATRKTDNIPAWELGTWREVGWNFRLEQNGVTHGTVISFIAKEDKLNAGHLNCALVLWNDCVLRVTSMKWLHVRSHVEHHQRQ